MKYNSSGSIAWSTYYGGSDEERGNVSVSLNSSGNLFFEGQTWSDNIIILQTGNQYNDPNNNCNGSSCFDQIIGKLSNTGGLLWSSFFGGDKNFSSGDIVVDENDDIYLSGNNYGDDINAFSVNPGGGAYHNNSTSNSFYLVKFSGQNLNIIWGTGFDMGWPITIDIDNSNRLLVSGYGFSSSIFNITNNTGNGNAYLHSYHGGISDNFIARFNTNLSVNWATYIGGTYRDVGYKIGVLPNNIIVSTGSTNSTNFYTCSSNVSASIIGSYQGPDPQIGIGDAFLT